MEMENDFEGQMFNVPKVRVAMPRMSSIQVYPLTFRLPRRLQKIDAIVGVPGGIDERVRVFSLELSYCFSSKSSR